MIRETTLSQEEMKEAGIVPGSTRFQESALAHYYLDDLQGIELGPSSHNGFNLRGSIAVAPIDDDGGPDNNFYRNQQIMMCGTYAVVEVDAEAENLPFEDNSQGYVLSSHVFEHLPNPIQALIEWNRVVKHDGYIFMIVPHSDALESDRSLPVSTIQELNECLQNRVTVDTWDYETKPIPGGRRGHYHRYTLQTLLDLIELASVVTMGNLNWQIIEAREIDDKVGNGHCIVARVNKEEKSPVYTEYRKESDIDPAFEIQPRDVAEDEMLQSVEIEQPIQVPEEVKAIITEAAAELQPEQIVRKKPGRKAKAKS